MKVVILEDEAPARRLLVRLLKERGWEVIAELDSEESGRAYFKANPTPDLVISDIRLADGSALSLFSEGIVEAPVIFVTAYDTWLEQALKFLSVDYLLKPIERKAFHDALDKFERLGRHFSRVNASQADALSGKKPRQRVLLRHKAEMRALPVEEVAYFRADDKLTLAVERGGRESVVERTLSELEAELDPAQFFRANRGYLVHVSAIVSFRSAGRGRLALTLAPAPKDEVLVSQDNAAAFRRFMDR